MQPFRVSWAGEREAHIAVPPGDTAGWYKRVIGARVEGVAEIAPGTRTIQFRIASDADPRIVLDRVRSVLVGIAETPTHDAPRVVEIPICSDPDLAPDLDDIARGAGMTPHAAAERHASAEYTVRFIGFSPGFPYLAGLPEELHAPRHNTPRARVRAGSVAIAGAHTGIYPDATPGGWRLIGATPMRLFDPAREPPALLAPGDTVRFRRIDRRAFDAIEAGRAS
jgi:KipI family sensor histidine kinase inhibitor